MTRSCLESLSTRSSLNDAWQRFWRKSRRQTSSGIDYVTPASFNKRLETNLHTIRSELLRGYRYDALVAHSVPKPDGHKERIICVPTVRDRLVQRLLGEYLLDRGERFGIVNDASYGFIRGTEKKPRGVLAARNRAIDLRRQYPFAYKSDITSFFDRIPRDILFKQVIRIVRTPSLEQPLHGAIHCEIDLSNPTIQRKVHKAGIEQGLGVRQGMPLSPFFANIILKEFDKLFLLRGLHLVRYADDFIVLANSRKECLEIDRIARDTLEKLRFEIPEIDDARGKTRICEPQESVEFLGLSFAPTAGGDYALMITPAQINKIRRSLFVLKDIEHLQRQGINVVNLSRILENKIAGYRSAYPSSCIANSDLLATTLDQARSTILTSIFANIFGKESISQLSAAQKEFLCLDTPSH